MTLNISDLNILLYILFIWGGVFLAALWLSLLLWTMRDIRARSKNVLTCLLAVLVVAVLFLPGIIIYLILRPPRTIEGEYQLALKEEAFLQSIEEKLACPGCSRNMAEDWIVCPWCHTRIRKICPHCGKLMELQWNMCPFCTSPAQGGDRSKTNPDFLHNQDPENDDSAPNNKPSQKTF